MGFHRARVYYAQKTNANLIDVVIQDYVDCKGLVYCMVHAPSLINLGLLIPSILKDLIVIMAINKKPIETGNTSLVDVQTLCADLVYDFTKHTESALHTVITDCSPLDLNTEEKPIKVEELTRIDISIPDPLTIQNIPPVVERLQSYLTRFETIDARRTALQTEFDRYTAMLEADKPDNYTAMVTAKRLYLANFDATHNYTVTKATVNNLRDQLNARLLELQQQQP
jgi:hypothetical protein